MFNLEPFYDVKMVDATALWFWRIGVVNEKSPRMVVKLPA